MKDVIACPLSIHFNLPLKGIYFGKDKHDYCLPAERISDAYMQEKQLSTMSRLCRKTYIHTAINLLTYLDEISNLSCALKACLAGKTKKMKKEFAGTIKDIVTAIETGFLISFIE